MKKTISLLLSALLVCLIFISCRNTYIPIWMIPGYGEEEPEPNVTTPYDVTNEEEFDKMFSSENRVRLTSDVTIDWIVASTEPKTVDLNGHTLTIDGHESSGWGYWIYAPAGGNLTIQNGSLRFEKGDLSTTSSNTGVIDIFNNASVTFDSVDFYSPISGIAMTYPNASFTAIDSKIKAEYIAIGTNASDSPSGINIRLTRTNVTGGDCALNLTTNGTFELNDCDISAGHIGMLVRGGSATINGGKIHSDASNPVESNSDYNFHDYVESWGSGTDVAYAALTVGNYYGDNAYNYTTNVVIRDCKITTDKTAVAPEAARIYVASSGEKVDLDIDNQEYADEIKENKWYGGDNTYLTVTTNGASSTEKLERE